MPLVATDAIVLHAFDYLETSRILRLLTREAGLLSVLAKGARRNRAKYGSAVDLFAEGEAQIYLKPGRDLNTLGSFDVVSARLGIADDFDRFSAASAVAELVLRGGRDDPNPQLYQAVADTLQQIANAPADALASEAVGGLWRIVSALGFTPALDSCANCHTTIAPDTRTAFAHAQGGVLCDRCARTAPRRRILPPEARHAIRAWLDRDPSHAQETSDSTALLIDSAAGLRAHQRLLREFVQEHVGSERPLRAFLSWEALRWRE